MAKIRKPSPPSAQSPQSPGSAPEAGRDDDHRDGDFPEFAPRDLTDISQNPPQTASAAADGDLTLDDHEDRQQQRPRLPDQRREKKSFEMGAPIMPVKDSPLPDSWESAAPAKSSPDSPSAADDIASYDPLAAEAVARPSAPPRPGPSQMVKVPSTPELDELEEFIARTANEGPAHDKVEKVRQPFTLLEKICSAAGIAILIAASVWLITSITSEANGLVEASTPWPDLPMEGALVTITEASTFWRGRKETDRVAQMEVVLPVPGQQMPGIIPEVSFTIDPAKSSKGFLRFIFKDTEGKPRGDTRVVEVEGGKLMDMGKGEIIKGGTEASIYGSYGLLNTAAYRSYEGDDKPRWSVEIAESTSYNADDKDWKILGTFNVRNHLAD